MAALTSFVLKHKWFVLAGWLVVLISAVAAVGPAGGALSQQFSVPGREGFETNEELAAIYGSGGDVAPIVPVVQLPPGTTVDSPGVREELGKAVARIEATLPGAMTASYASTGDRAFVSDDGRTTFGLVYIPAKGGVDPGQEEAHAAQAALAGVTVGGAPVEVTGLDALRASAGTREQRYGRPARHPAGGAGRAPRARLRLPFAHGIRAAADGAGRHPDDLSARLAARERDRCIGDRAVPRCVGRARDRDRLRAPNRRALARRAAAVRRDQRGRSTEGDAARRRRRRLQRDHRGDLIARAARPAGAVHAQHRHRRADDRARQRRRRDHAAPRRAGDDRPQVRLAAQLARRKREPRLVHMGATRRTTPLGRSGGVDSCSRRAGRGCILDPAREPRAPTRSHRTGLRASRS